MLLETVGGAYLSPLVQVLLDRVAVPLIINFFQNRDFDETLLERLKTVLLTVNAVISDAEESEITNLVVKDWVNELKDAVYDADDLSCEIQTIALHRQLEDAKVNRDQVTGQIFTHHPSLSHDEDIESRLEKIIKRLESLSKKIDLLNLKRSVARKPPIMLPSTSLVDESEVFGRGKDKEELLKSLLGGTVAENRIPVIAIVGIGGVGKTTLAQLLYNDSRVKGHFNLRAWAHVSEEFDVYKVTKIIFESVTSKICNLTDLNILQVRLKVILTGMRFLLVLDDIWNGNFIDWDFMLSPLKAGHCSSRIIVTTRNQNVASTMKPLLTYRLPHLSDEACWELFAKHAFKASTPEEHLILKRIGEDIAKKCKGLPLAAKTLGGLLHPEVEAEQWHAILNSKIWDLPNDKSSILPALLLSYYNLPPHLKRCFAYCSIIPKGFKFYREKLILMWMAEDFLQQPKGQDRLEDVGTVYFQELVSRSFFQLSPDNQFEMHDLVNDLAQFVSGEFCLKVEDSKPCGVSEKVRHLAFLTNRFNGPEKFVHLRELKSLRTFLLLASSNISTRPAFSHIVHNLWLQSNKYLRVLSFSYHGISELPYLGKLVHLRYLDLSHTFIKEVPSWTCSLYNLQTLLLSGCYQLTSLPANIGDLINLLHLDVRETNLTNMPHGFGRLKSLRVLTNFVVRKDSGANINELGNLPHLRKTLCISKLENVDDAADASNAKLKEKNHLNELVFQWNSDTHDEQPEIEVLRNLQPHENLKKLTIENYGGTRFPEWLGDAIFTNMVFLRLTKCKKCTSLPPLGQLSCLQELSISNMEDLKRLDSGFYGNPHFRAKPFRSLKTLLFENLPRWEHWELLANEDELFPSLQELQIQQCHSLIGSLPKHLGSLTKLVVSGCMKLEASILMAPTLKEMKLHGLDKLKTLPEELLKGNSSFHQLEIINCCSLSSFPGDDFLNTATSISISDCNKLELVLPENNALKHLHITSSCNSVGSLPLGLLTKLQSLYIKDCNNLKSLSIQNAVLKFLQEMEIKDCPNLESLHEGGLNTCLCCLQTLNLSGCLKLSQFSEGSLPLSLKSLCITNCNNLTPTKEWGLHKMVSLTCFEIEGGCSDVELFPEEGLLPSTLTSLRISRLPKLKFLIKGLTDLTSLEKLDINCCEKLESMPAEGLPTSLTSLLISTLPNLKFLVRGLKDLTLLTTLDIICCDRLELLPEERFPPSLLYLNIKNCSQLGPHCQEGGKDRPKISPETRVCID